MNYIFVFLGEFGYELLNWQGVVRKFATTIDRKKDKIIICTRKGLESFYEFADKYIDISELPYFKNSAASMYWAHNPDINYYKHHEDALRGSIPQEMFSKKDISYQKVLKKEIISYALSKLKLNIFDKFIFKNYKFIFSSDYQVLHGLTFGSVSTASSKIYADLDLNNNIFIKPDILRAENIYRSKIENSLGFDLSEEYILCQTGVRNVIVRSKDHISLDVVKEIAKTKKVVLLDFNTGRNLDSKSEFEQVENCYRYSCSTFNEQSVLIANSKYCLFFTEGDFRSHNYIPPFMGKDVYAVAPKTVFDLPTTPIDFWNKNVFKFGGQIKPIYYEDIDKENFKFEDM